MKTVVSKTGVEVLYPCSIHLLTGEILECEYKSDQIGHELMDYIGDHLALQDKEYWGFRFLDYFEQRHWLDLNKLIRSQVKNVCPIHLLFRVKVYPPEPYKMEEPTKTQIFMQLRLDLKSGRLCCGISDAALLLGLILQYQLGDFKQELHFGNYVKEKYLQHQSFVIEMKAIAFHKDHLTGINKDQTKDLFLRLASQLETYGVEPFLIEDSNKQKMTLWINYKGMETYVNAEIIYHLDWLAISRIKQDNCTIFVHTTTGEVTEIICLTKAECNYIYESAVEHLRYFTTSGAKSTTGIIGSESNEDVDEEINRMNIENLNDEDALTNPDRELSTIFSEEKVITKLEKIPMTKLIMKKISNWRVAVTIVFFAVIIELYFFSDHETLNQTNLKRFWDNLVKGY